MGKKVKTILISQPKPSDENSPYYKLVDKWGLKIDFRKFIQIEGITTNEFRKQGLNPLDFTAVIFTSKYSIDHYFRILADLKIELPADMKYYCVSEATAKYLQKYIVIRKRKLYVGNRTSRDLIEVVKKHPKEKYIFPCSAIHTRHLTDWMEEKGFNLEKAIIYNTVPSDLSDLSDVKYDMICFYSPSGVDSLLKNFPGFEQNDTVVAVFGPTTAKAVQDAGLRVDVQAPSPSMPSMTSAIETYLKEFN
ncbi:MAG TPA: uroporphyrinogen-III synthase [Bacteroidetes bacterium]|nr:uroporphyrinogen-III synthase [Bacteroidota bacterium]